MEKQTTLTIARPPKPELAHVPVDRLPDPDVEVRTDLLANVQSSGILQSVALVRSGEGYEIADGRHRIACAQEADLEAVPALIFPEGTPRSVAASITLSTNFLRKPNPARELAAIEHLVEQGLGEDEIATDLRLNRSTLRKRMKLAKLAPALRDAFDAGDIAVSVAEKAATLSKEKQDGLVEVLAETGKLTGSDVRDAKKARKEQAVSLLPDEMFDGPGASDDATTRTSGPWNGTRAALESALKQIPQGEPEWAAVQSELTALVARVRALDSEAGRKEAVA